MRSNGHFKVMPLPGLLGKHYSVHFDQFGLVESKTLDLTKRRPSYAKIGLPRKDR